MHECVYAGMVEVKLCEWHDSKAIMPFLIIKNGYLLTFLFCASRWAVDLFQNASFALNKMKEVI
jgi:hypothetical protein